MKNQNSHDYEPFGPEWENELMKTPKHFLENAFGVSGEGITKRQQIKIIKANLLKAKASVKK